MDAVSLLVDFQTYLGSDSSFDFRRGQLVLQLAIDRCAAVLSPLPDSAMGIVFDVAQRAYSNVSGATSATVGPFSQTLPPVGVSLTAANRRELRLLGGRGGAFTIDPTPADAGKGMPSWDQNVTWLNGEPILDEWQP